MSLNLRCTRRSCRKRLTIHAGQRIRELEAKNEELQAKINFLTAKLMSDARS